MPPPTQETRTCQWCPHAPGCSALHRAVEGGTRNTAGGVTGLFQEQDKAMRDNHRTFLQTWERWLSLEVSASESRTSDMWTRTALDRQSASGQCIAGLVLLPPQPHHSNAIKRGGAGEHQERKKTSVQEEGGEGDDDDEEERLLYTFVQESPSVALDEMAGFSEGSYVVVSTECGVVAAAHGKVHAIQGSDRITLMLRRKLTLPSSSSSLSPPSLRGSSSSSSSSHHHHHHSPAPPSIWNVRWRVDKTESGTLTAKLRGNVLKVLTDPACEGVRTSAVDLAPPSFQPLDCPSMKSTLTNPAVIESLGVLNEDQRNALIKALSMEQYCLIQGLPGTGKTTTICRIIQTLVALGKTVLVTSYTNSAVDNILSRLIHLKVDFLRLGSDGSVAPEILPFTLGGSNFPCSSAAEIAQVTSQVKVVASTCFGASHPLFLLRKFDVCIVDEAGQMTIPAVLGPLGQCRSFVLVGDHHQLPPLVISKQAKEEGADVSLFRQLAESRPESLVELTVQHRMAQDIMSLSNRLVYQGRLQAASPQVAQRRLPTSLAAGPSATSPPYPAWLKRVVDPEMRVVFLDTDSMGPSALEQRKGKSVSNLEEAKLVAEIAGALVSDAGLRGGDIAALSPYNSQVLLMQRQLEARNVHQNVHTLTLDRSQGRDWQCVLVSLVASNEAKETGPLLGDLRRVNVALTRAKAKLVLIGSASTLSSQSHWTELLELVGANGWLVRSKSQ